MYMNQVPEVVSKYARVLAGISGWYLKGAVASQAISLARTLDPRRTGSELGSVDGRVQEHPF